MIPLVLVELPFSIVSGVAKLPHDEVRSIPGKDRQGPTEKVEKSFPVPVSSPETILRREHTALLE